MSKRTIPAVKDEEAAHPVASAWRDTLTALVEAFVRDDYEVSNEIPQVAPISAERANQMRRYVSDYGETLQALPEATWESSVAQWMGSHWDVLIDLWTEESGESDLVLAARVFEAVNDAIRIEVDSITVP